MLNVKKSMSGKVVVLIVTCLISSNMCDDIEQKLAKINTDGLPESVLYEAAGLNTVARSPLTKAQLAKALQDPQIEAAAIRSALKYATDTADIKAAPSYARNGETSSYCDYSWVTWLPFMDCPIADSIESREEVGIKETGSSCYKGS